MAFLDNSGDIILDAVLTDLGRMRLARGDGSFKITQFALGDDEIDYAQYDKNDTNGSAYYDLNILQTPILEAFTNNTSLLKAKLVSLPRTDLLHLPILKLNQNDARNRLHSTGNALNKFVVSVDKETSQGVVADSDAAKDAGILPNNGLLIDGYINGVDVPGTIPGAAFIRIDQGIDNEEVSPTTTLDPTLIETQYIIEIDDRLGSIVNSNGTTIAAVNFVDDDNIASYYVTSNTNINSITNIQNETSVGNDTEIKGPRGTRLQFKIRTSLEVQQSDFLFGRLGKKSQNWVLATGTGVTPTAGTTTTVHYIDTTIRVTGVVTGYRLDIPIRLVKKA